MSALARTGTILDRIVEARRVAIANGKRRVPEAVLRMNLRKVAPPRDFAAALAGDGVHIIAELKKASPSLGVIREDFDPAALAASLAAAGAAALSVLTEEEHFQGSLANLHRARQACALPLLRKDFIVDPWQLWEARTAEADAFLLIAAILSDAQMRSLLALGRELRMSALVEVHTREELARALDAGARIIGINNRDLRTFTVRLETALALVEHVPEGCLAVAESGLRTAADIAQLRAAGFDAFLVGEHLMKAPDAAAALQALRA
jgi:indole-3-glycerol phosphate synthase